MYIIEAGQFTDSRMAPHSQSAAMYTVFVGFGFSWFWVRDVFLYF